MAAKWITPARKFDLSATDTNVLVALINYANKKTRVAWPAVSRLMWDTGLGKNTIIRSLGRLDEFGILDRVSEPTPNFPARYRFNPDAAHPHKKPYKARNEYPERVPGTEDASTHSGRASTQSGSDEYPERVPNRKEPSYEPSSDEKPITDEDLTAAADSIRGER